MLPAYCTRRPGKALQELCEFHKRFSRSQLRLVALQEFIGPRWNSQSMRRAEKIILLVVECRSWLFRECRLTGLEWPLPGACLYTRHRQLCSLLRAFKLPVLCSDSIVYDLWISRARSCLGLRAQVFRHQPKLSVVFDSGSAGLLPKTAPESISKQNEHGLLPLEDRSLPLTCGALKTDRAFFASLLAPMPRLCRRCQMQRHPGIVCSNTASRLQCYHGHAEHKQED